MDRAELKADERSSHRVFFALGVLWLLLAAAIIVSQFNRPTPITIEWRTETEINTAGFNVYRANSVDGSFTRLNEQLIPSRGSPVSGASYTFTDEDVVPGETYYYQLEDVELDNSSQQHATIDYTAPLAPWWVKAIAAISILAGLLLLVKGLQAEKSR